MHLTFQKEFSGDLNELPVREVPGAVQFREFGDMQKLSLYANLLALVIMIPLLIPVGIQFVRRLDDIVVFGLWQVILLLFLLIITIPVHELLHASCFKGDVYFYTYLKKGLAFVTGTESMTKGRFIFMSLLPNLVLGLLPYLLYLIFPGQFWLGLFGACNIASGAGDYINVWNAATQMPKGSLCFMSGMHTYWYLPENVPDETEEQE